MPRQKYQHQSALIPLLAATLVGVGTPISYGQEAIKATPETARSADAFVDSTCVNTHWEFANSVYGENYNGVKQKLVELGIRHVRNGGSSASVIAKMKELAGLGIKTNYIIDPKVGVAPNSSYWTGGPSYYIKDFVKNKVGTNVIDAVEPFNEIDLFYKLHDGYYWHPNDTQKVNSDPNSPLYWVKYATSVTKDTFEALKSDPATANVKVIGPSLGTTYDYNNRPPLGDLSGYVDWGNFHPYAFGGNPFSNPFSYDTISQYYSYGNFPSINIDEWPFALEVGKLPYGSKPMAVTETGYYTTNTDKGISEKVQAKYVPRLFLEFFRKGIVRTCYYDFVDDGTDPNNPQDNFGLLRNNLTPKPAYTALKNLLSLLKDPGSSFTPGSLDFALSVTPPAEYNRTQYVHHLLLQKRDGTFYLVLWHEISNGDISSTPVREIAPPAMPTQLKLTTPIKNAVVYSLDDSGNMSSQAATISQNTISLNVTDKAVIIQLKPF